MTIYASQRRRYNQNNTNPALDEVRGSVVVLRDALNL